MNRLTSNKNATDMSMMELAHNSCYADKRNARYRDYELDIDARELVRNLAKDICDEDLSDLSNEEFDEYMAEMLSVEMDSQIGLLALFYRNLWAMADLREKLKEYEDLEEQGRLVKLPCKVGDTIYIIAPKSCDCTGECDLYNSLKWCKKYCPNGFKGSGVLETVIQRIEIRENDTYVMTDKDGLRDLGNIFLTKSEAEAILKELREKR